MNIFKQIKDLVKKVLSLEEAIVNPTERAKWLKPEMTLKLDIKEFEKFKKEVVGEKKSNFYEYFVCMDFGCGPAKKADQITLFDRITAMEKYLGVEYKNETKEFNGYKKIPTKKK